MRGVPTKAVVAIGLLVTLVLAGLLSHYASASPDGLERVAEDQGFLDRAEDHPGADGLFADYGFGDSDDPRVAGVVGSLVVLALTSGAVYVLRRGGGRDAHGPAESPDRG